MVKPEARSCRRGAGTKMGRAALAALLIGLGGCNPVETYRHLTGISENDPNPQTTPNTKNLAAGDAKSYPNLATVPAPPTQALTTAELNKLTQSLIADRANAKYTSENLQAKFDEAAAPPPPPPPPPPAPAAGEAKPATVTLGAPGAGPAPAGGPAAPPGGAPAAPATAPAAAPPAPGAVSAPSASAAGAGAKTARNTAPKAGQPPEPGPMESSLQSPQIATLPQPEQNQPASAPPRALGVPAPAANATAPGARLPAPPAQAPMPAAIGSAKFQAAPPPPDLPAPAPVRTATATASAKPPKPAAPAAAYAQVADIAFSGDATALSDADRRSLDKIVPRYREKPGLVRVVGYAGVGSSAAQQLDSYRTALDRAQAVAAALAKAGIPADKIQVEAAPAGSGAGQGRAEILFAQ